MCKRWLTMRLLWILRDPGRSCRLMLEEVEERVLRCALVRGASSVHLLALSTRAMLV